MPRKVYDGNGKLIQVLEDEEPGEIYELEDKNKPSIDYDEEELDEPIEEMKEIYADDKSAFDKNEFEQGLDVDKYKNKKIFFYGKPNYLDIKQNQNGAYHLLSSLSALATSQPKLIENLINDNGDGTVTVNLYAIDKNDGNKKKLLPVRVDKTPAKLDPSSGDWVRYFEKAVAASGLIKSNGTIPNEKINEKGEFIGKDVKLENELNGGDPQVVMSFLLPSTINPVSKLEDDIINKTDEQEALDTFTEMFNVALENNFPITAYMNDLGRAVTIDRIDEKYGVKCIHIIDPLKGDYYEKIEEVFKGNSYISNIVIYPIENEGYETLKVQFINTNTLYKNFQAKQAEKANAPAKLNKEEAKPVIQNAPKNDEPVDDGTKHIKNEQIEEYRKAIGECAKKLEEAKTLVNSKEYKQLIMIMKNVASGTGKELMQGSNEAATFTNQVSYIYNVLDKYLEHKAKDGVKSNAYKKLLEVENAAKLVGECIESLGNRKIEHPANETNAPLCLNDIRTDYNEYKAVDQSKYGRIGGAPERKDITELTTSAQKITAPGENIDDHINNVQAVDDCMCKIIFKAQRKHYPTVNDLRKQREEFINNPQRVDDGKTLKKVSQSGQRTM